MTQNEKFAYLAGLIDGEGNIRIDCRKNPKKYIRTKKEGYSITEFVNYPMRLTVANTDKKMVDWCKENFGGFIWTRKRDDDFAKSRGWKNVYHWIKSLNTPSIELVKNLVPYLITKKDRMELIVEFLKTKSTNGVRITEDIRKERLEIINKLNILNKRGI